MEESKKYSRRIKSFFRSLKRKFPRPEPPVYDEPTEALIYGIVSEKITQDQTDSVIEKFKEHFIDLNDLRISPTQEIVELFGDKNEIAKSAASDITGILKAIFDRYNTVSLFELRKIGKRPAREILTQLCSSPFAVDYCVLTSLGGHTIPLTAKMIEYLRAEELVNPPADQDDIEGFLARQIAAKDAYNFYFLLRRQSEKPAGAKDTENVRAKRKGKKKVKTRARKK